MDFSGWNELEKLLYKLSEQKFETKKDAYLISPAVYKPDTTRANRNVTDWAGWAAIDVDDYIPEGSLEDDLRSRFNSFYFVCYSTASSKIHRPKCRIVFPLLQKVKSDKIKHFWYALNTEAGEMGDPQTKDLSRMYYIPGHYANAYNFIFTHNGGQYIDPLELMNRHPYVEKKSGNSFIDNLPEELQKQVIQHRKSKLENKSKYSWAGLHDCPFVNKRMIAEYKSISETGWYHKMYQFMVSLAFNAIRSGYPITEYEIEQLTRELDMETGNWYEKRPIKSEANSALNYAYKNSEISL